MSTVFPELRIPEGEHPVPGDMPLRAADPDIPVERVDTPAV